MNELSKQWLEIAYPIEASETEAGIPAIEHSLNKWKAARLLSQYGLTSDGISIVEIETTDDILDFGIYECSLCQHYYTHGHPTHDCSDCPIYLKFEHDCISAYQKFTLEGNPEPMIELLEKTLQAAKDGLIKF